MTRATYNTDNTITELPGMEVWKPVPGYEGLYEVSSLGRFKSIERLVFREKVGYTAVPERILIQDFKARYLYVGLSRGGKSKSYRAHRLVCATFHLNPENKPHVNHKNRNRLDNRATNLEWCTAKENVNYSLKFGHNRKGVRGEKNHWTKLTERDVYELADHVKAGGSVKKFAKLKKVAYQTIACIIKGKTWAHIPINWADYYKPNIKHFSHEYRKRLNETK